MGYASGGWLSGNPELELEDAALLDRDHDWGAGGGPTGGADARYIATMLVAVDV